MTAGRSQHVTISRQAMACTFCLVFPAGERKAVEAGCAALDEVERLEAKLTVYDADSDIRRINREAATRPMIADAEVFGILETAARISADTDGAFDISSGALSRAWGFYKGPKHVPDEPVCLAALAASGMSHVAVDADSRTVGFRRPGVELNLGAIGKGYAIDRALALIEAEYGAGCVLMHGGRSSIRAIGTPPGETGGWKVAIADPFKEGRAIASVRLNNRALGTSGAAHQFFVHNGRRYGHVLDTRTGRPAHRVAGATALAPTAAEADALSTAFFVMGVEGARAYVRTHPGIAAILVTMPRAGAPPEVVVLGIDPAEIEFFPLPHSRPAGSAQPPKHVRPAGFLSGHPETGAVDVAKRGQATQSRNEKRISGLRSQSPFCSVSHEVTNA